MALTFNCKLTFDLDIDSVHYGKFIFIDDTDYIGEGINPADVKGWFEFKYPDGTTYNGSSTNPDILPNISAENNLVQVPADVNGDWLEGNYVFKYIVEVVGAVQPGLYNKVLNFKYCANFKFRGGEEACLEETVDCFKYQIGVKDATKYGNPDSLQRLITLFVPPILVTEGKASNQTTNAGSLIYTFGYTGGYSANINAAVNYQTGVIQVTGRVKATIDILVQCSQNICKIIACYAEHLEKLRNQLSRNVLNSAVDNVLLNNVTMAQLYITQYQYAGRCGNSVLASEAFTMLQGLLKCDCGCTNGKNDVQLVNPDFSTAVTQIFTFVANNPLTVNTTTVGNNTTVTYSLSQSFLDSITDITNAISVLQGQMNTANTNITNLQSAVNGIDELRQIRQVFGSLQVPNTGIWTTTAQYSALINTLKVNSELVLKAWFNALGGADAERNIQILVNAVPILTLNSAAFQTGAAFQAEAILTVQVITNTTIRLQSTINWTNTNFAKMEKEFFTDLVINNITSQANTFSIQGKAIQNLFQLNANVKQYNLI